MLRELAAWYRGFAARAANPVIWESRLLTAEDLDAEASRMSNSGHLTDRRRRRTELLAIRPQLDAAIVDAPSNRLSG
jgi:hypothetical protein